MTVAQISCKKVGWVEEWVDGLIGGKARLRIAYSNQKKKERVSGKLMQW